MAALTSSAVVKEDVYYDQGDLNHQKLKVVPAILTLTGQGGLTNNIPATLFGMSKIRRVHSARLSTSVQVQAGPSYDGAYLVLGAADGSTGGPTDISGTLKVIVVGVE